MVGDLPAWLATQCERLASRATLRHRRDLLLDIATHAREPLRVAVTGDVSSGKSSLVNALLGARVATVQHAETTAHVTWYRGTGAHVPPLLTPEHRAESVDAPLLRSITLVDTPGVNTVTGRQRPTEAMIDASTSTAGSVSALLYLCAGEVSNETMCRIKKFSDLTTGPLDEGVNIALCASKADDLVGGDLCQRDELITLFRSRGDRYAAHALAVSPALAMASLEVANDAQVLAALATIARSDRLRAAAAGGWAALRAASEAEAAEVVPLLGRLEAMCGTTIGVSNAVDLIAGCAPDLGTAVAASWRKLSGLDDCERLLAAMAASADVLTVSSVRGRLRRLATQLGTALGSPVNAVLVQERRHPGALTHERRAAALVLDGDVLRHISFEERAEAAALLRGVPAVAPSAATVARWQRRAEQPGRSSTAQYIAGVVAESAAAHLERSVDA